MRNPLTHHSLRRRSRFGTAGALLALAALALAPAGAQAASVPSDMSLTFTGQTGTTTWSANPLTVEATAATTDSSDPVYQTFCSVDQGASTTVLGTQQKVPVSGDGVHIVACYPVSLDGTVGPTEYATVQLDDQIPSVALAGAPASPTWNSGSVTVTADASETTPLSGIASVTCLDGAGNQTTTPGSVGSITVTGTQRYSVSCYATTNANVIGARTYEQVWLDNTAPTVSYLDAPMATQWYNAGQPVTIQVQTPSGGAPIASVTCDYNGRAILPNGQLTEQAPAALHSWTLQVTLPGTDSGNASCFATDTAGNISSTIAALQRVDTGDPTGVFVKENSNPAVILAKVTDGLSGIYGATIQYQQHGHWLTLPTTVKNGLVKAIIPANNPITAGKHNLRVVVTDNADNTYDGTQYQNGKPAVLDYPVAAGLHLLYTIVPAGKDIYGHPADNTDSNAQLRLAYGQAADIQGRLYSSARTLVANQLVTIKVTLADRQFYVIRRRTDKAGFWHYRLPAGGDRSIKISYAGSVGLAAQSHIITVRNQAAVKLAVNPLKYGQWTLVGARVLGGSIPHKGLWVVVQWRRNANSPWVEFSHLRPTGASGTMRVGVPVPPVPAGTHVQIRAVVPATHGWGYAGATSPILNTVIH